MFAQRSMKVTSTATVACSEAAHLAPDRERPRIGWELTLRATLSLHHMQKNALFNSTKESQIDQKKKEKNSSAIPAYNLWKDWPQQGRLVCSTESVSVIQGAYILSRNINISRLTQTFALKNTWPHILWIERLVEKFISTWEAVENILAPQHIWQLLRWW